ncbi:DUF6129 family protein [Bradyrhizobium canariense]|uniref:DUF6129 domain-containing protein n=1 Tax=Bradyrhizobium canariense TaxID=255045 RepID=A0A1X3FGK4_9BRAD|nr:DUF6129 family protein [Bradyrhizobium canariense]OSI65741.1 hypothetical protein BSZ22_28735 [Bradyrhizobium canariense]OSI76190.1 hypothetical protein BSZ23_25270 [Bradyrhizobium canariense]OSI87655.1 hypothetical protein BSZ25_27010 [Bradyrhizobium canariense]OSI87707.1 hypothetical protein BSZ24_25870 [Bradyrhizobium canariense]OSI99693.1 hypothetical protein BSZ16_26725 [Bradyrhizobium canariense]
MLPEGELTNIEHTLASTDTDSEACLMLRQRFPHLAWICCEASDITQSPFHRLGQFDLHLLDSGGHCAQITNDPQRATGIVLAKRSGNS